MKRICHVCSAHPADDGRVFERACVSLANAGYDVHLLARSRDTGIYQSRNVTIHPVPPTSSRWERFFFREKIAGLASELYPDLYHVHEPELLGSVLAVARDRPVIWDVHEPYQDYLLYKPWLPRPIRPAVRLAWNALERHWVRQCAAVICATSHLTVRYLGWASRISVVSNYPRLDRIDTFNNHVAREPGSLVFTGSLASNRGLGQTIRALALLSKRGIKVTLELAGAQFYDGYVDELLDDARSLGVRDQITYHGILPRNQALELQARCSIGMNNSFPSPGHLKGFPIKLLEFMQIGLPVIYSDLPTMREIAGEAGIAVDPSRPDQIADAIELLVKDPDLARKYGENGRRIINERLNWNVEWPKLQDVYMQLIGPP